MSERLAHLQAYRSIIFYDDIFIIAPQIIAVFDDLLHIDLFTVTTEKFVGKDYFKVVYDPNHLLDNFMGKQGLMLTEIEYRDNVNDVGWFLFQYKKAAARGNDIWAVRMLTNVMDHVTRVLLYRYAPGRAQLGLKTIHHSMPKPILSEVDEIFEHITPRKHPMASYLISKLLSREFEWINVNLSQADQIKFLLQKMIKFHLDKKLS